VNWQHPSGYGCTDYCLIESYSCFTLVQDETLSTITALA
jgi:hypothetical protein